MNAGGAVVAGALAAGAAVLVISAPGAGPDRLRDLFADRGPPDVVADPPAQRPLARGRRLAAVAVGLAVLNAMGGAAGVVLGLVLGMLSHHLLGRVEPRAAVAARERAARDLPIAVHLVATAIKAGAAPVRALELSANGVGGPVGVELRRLAASASLGGDLTAACLTLPAHSPLAPLARTLARALESGAPLAGPLTRLATDLRARRRAEIDRRARSVGVRAAAPLGLCFLPAFLLIGVVPVVVGLASRLLGEVL